MNLGSDTSQGEFGGTPLKFPTSPIVARKTDRDRQKYWLAAAIGALCVLAGVGALWWSLGGKSPIQYLAAPVTRGAISRTATATGTVNPVLTIIIGAYDSGVIQNIYSTTTPMSGPGPAIRLWSATASNQAPSTTSRSAISANSSKIKSDSAIARQKNDRRQTAMAATIVQLL